MTLTQCDAFEIFYDTHRVKLKTKKSLYRKFPFLLSNFLTRKEVRETQLMFYPFPLKGFDLRGLQTTDVLVLEVHTVTRKIGFR